MYGSPGNDDGAIDVRRQRPRHEDGERREEDERGRMCFFNVTSGMIAERLAPRSFTDGSRRTRRMNRRSLNAEVITLLERQ